MSGHNWKEHGEDANSLVAAGTAFSQSNFTPTYYGLAVGAGGISAPSSNASFANVSIGDNLIAADIILDGQLVLEAYETVAATGTNQGTAAALSAALTVHDATGGDGTVGVVLPTAVVGRTHLVYNNSTSALKVYPNTSDDINDGSANAAIILGSKKSALFVALDSVTWSMRGTDAATTFTQTYSTADATVAAPTAVTGSSSAGANGYSSAGEAAAIQTAVNALVADDLDNRKTITAIIDALQAAGIVL